MARIYPTRIGVPEPGELSIEEYHSGFIGVFYIPPHERLREARLKSEKPELYKRHILDVDITKDFVSIYPLNTLPRNSGFLEPKYDVVRSITLEGFGFGLPESTEEVIEMLEELPSAFIKDYDFGLGLLKDFMPIIDFLEQVGIEHLVISKTAETHISEKDSIFTMKYREFEEFRKSMNRITNRARLASKKIKSVTTNNLIAYFLDNEDYPQKPYFVGNDALTRLIARSSPSIPQGLSKSEQKKAVALIEENKKAIAKDSPESLVKLQNTIELVTLEQLIEKYERMMQRRLSESHWQNLLNQNPFILNLAFGYPIVKIHDQASVGGRKLTGEGDKITDFLVKNSMTNNCAIFEIKTPQTKLLNKTPYRESVYTPSKDVAGSVNQVLDQKYKFQKEIAMLKENTGIYDMEAYATQCVLIVGTVPEDKEERKSFELFRRNSKDVEIVTFDELLNKLKDLRDFLLEDSESS
ncbi:DUF4263 domain-containing protein [Halioglobus maricola]|uniref:DUF4263 domain-containing protein n=1 Tax=Halioglobus maricola TaxID=2601894 RepID=A0A5P9NJM9_9GAMM|nr:Shedu immune nuclease family protein [Halioglobus maricola]QFU75932.1 DUF4263 domain-containing protein [Halioglobus maricola]